MLPDISREKQLGILRKMLMIRRAEEHVIHFNEDYEGLLRGHFHVYIGQEATGVAVCEALERDDYVFSTHRNHGHVIAKGGDPGKVLAEIIGRETGYCRRSEEHTSELQSLRHLVCRLLLEKKKKKNR